MNDRAGIWAGLAGIVLVALCCGGPLLVGAIGASALLAWGTHFILPAVGLLVVVLALVFYLRLRRTHATRDCCDDRSTAPPRNLQ